MIFCMKFFHSPRQITLWLHTMYVFEFGYLKDRSVSACVLCISRFQKYTYQMLLMHSFLYLKFYHKFFNILFLTESFLFLWRRKNWNNNDETNRKLVFLFVCKEKHDEKIFFRKGNILKFFAINFCILYAIYNLTFTKSIFRISAKRRRTKNDDQCIRNNINVPSVLNTKMNNVHFC